MKKCTLCKNEFPISEFPKRTDRPVGVKSRCKQCCYQKNKEWKHCNGDKVREYGRKHKKLLTLRNRKRLREIKQSSSCVDCGNTNWMVLEFDHVRGIKRDNVSSLSKYYSWSTVLAEIEKCEIRCRNCHRIRTPKSQSYVPLILLVQEYDASIIPICVDCGNEDVLVLDFDHVRGQKDKNINVLVRSRYSKRRIIQELRKCQTRCANCHVIRHFNKRTKLEKNESTEDSIVI